MEGKRRCPGCGAVFQSVDENLPGYLVPGKNPDEGVLCKRCFQMKHYGVYRKALLADAGFKKISGPMRWAPLLCFLSLT